MLGITSCGIYLPTLRLKAETIAQAWGRPLGRGEKAVAYYDEDSLTMGLAAAFACLGEADASSLAGLFFASTTSPYGEKAVASFLATALDLPETARTADFAGSLRSGSTALLSALDAVKGGSASQVMAVAADCRLVAPGTPAEPFMGDGAAAIMVGSQGVIAELEAAYSLYDEYADTWRKTGDLYLLSDDARFSQIAGYGRSMKAAIIGLLTKTGAKPADVSRLVTVSPDLRAQVGLARELGFAAEQVQDGTAGQTGLLGCAHPLILLAAALSETQPGQRILLGTYGDGADAFLFKVTDQIASFKKRQVVKEALGYSRELKNYGKYLAFRQLIKGEEPQEAGIFTSTSLTFRERDQNIKLYGLKCMGCNTISPLRIRVCPHCRSKDKFERVKLAKKGRLFSYTQEHYFPTPDPPLTMAVVDLEDGCRIFLQMTDTDPAQVKVGLEVELVLRRLHGAGGYYNYYWKCRPLKQGGAK